MATITSSDGWAIEVEDEFDSARLAWTSDAELDAFPSSSATWTPGCSSPTTAAGPIYPQAGKRTSTEVEGVVGRAGVAGARNLGVREDRADRLRSTWRSGP